MFLENLIFGSFSDLLSSLSDGVSSVLTPDEDRGRNDLVFLNDLALNLVFVFVSFELGQGLFEFNLNVSRVVSN